MLQFPLGAVVRPEFDYNYKLSVILNTEIHTASLKLQIRLKGATVESFINSIEEKSERTISPQQRVAIGIILANTYFCWENIKLTSEYSSILFNRSNQAMKKGRYNPTGVGIRPFRHAVDLMESSGFLICTKGFKGNQHEKGIASTFRPSSCLISWLIDNEDGLMACPTSKDRELLWLKKNGELTDYTDQLLQRQYREQLQLINSVNAQFNFSYQEYEKVEDESRQTGKVIKPASLFMEYRRHFNENWTTGGRLYNSLSSISKKERQSLLINNSPTVELDYGSLHLRIMYAEAGVIAPDSDLYAISGYPRAVMKEVALRVANCKSRNEALHSLILKGHDREAADEMLTQFEQAHSAIADHFYTEFWRVGMFTESRIGMKVMTRFAEAGKPILNIHDGFRVREKDEDLLRESMHQCYISEVGQKPVIDYD